MTRPRDLSFEALAEVTSTDWKAGRGELNVSLASIREQMPDLEDGQLAAEIVARARLYRRMFPDGAMTPTALAKHWKRVFEEQKRPAAGATNVTPQRPACATCDGHRFVLVAVRPAEQTHWMKERGFKASGGFEEYAPCPDCSSDIDASFRGVDGRVHRTPDPDRVREMMRA